jgi:hypothetical protein
MNRTLARRISRLERLVPAVLETRKQRLAEAKQRLPSIARHHATLVAGIVLKGEPKVDEPLTEAWARTVTNYNLSGPMLEEQRRRNFGSVASPTGNLDSISPAQQENGRHPLRAAEEIYPILLEPTFPKEKGNGDPLDKVYAAYLPPDKLEAHRFTEIFRAAPSWLLKFTSMSLDARVLGFELPDLTAAPQWGSAGLQDARRWPLLPLGTIAAGDPVPEPPTDFPSITESLLIPFSKWRVKEHLWSATQYQFALGVLEAVERIQAYARRKGIELGKSSSPPYK